MADEPLLTIRQVRAINAVATHASLARASEHLNTSQSSLSRYIAEAEGALSQQLFQRGWTGMEPTSQGEIVIATCRRMISSIEATQAALAATGARVADLSQHLTWEIIQTADAVLAAGSVSGAARSLKMSQPEVSRTLGKLSAAMGRPPFRRTRSGMKASDDAVILSGLHGRLRADLSSMPSLLAALAGEVTGRVAVGLLPSSEQDMVMRAFGELLRRHKHVRLLAVTGSYSALTDALRRGELDFVFGVLRTLPESDALEEMRLHDEAFAVVVRSDHPLTKAPLRLDDLVRENWMVAPHGTPSRRYFEQWLIGAGLTPPAQTCEIVTFHLAEQMIRHSDAVGLLTYSARKRELVRDGLTFLPVALPENLCEVGLTFRKYQPLSAAQRAFLDVLSA